MGAWIPGAAWAVPDDANTRVEALKKLLPFALDDTRITATVIAPAADRVVVTLTGEVYTTEEEQRFVKIVKDADPKAEVRSRIFVKSPSPPIPPEPEVTDLWTLTYIRSRVTPTSGELTQISTPDNIDLLVLALNSSFGAPGRPVAQRAGGGRLMLHGTKRRIIEIKRMLALVDAPWPQVQMNMWAIQVSGSPESVGWRVQVIGDLIRAVRDQMAEVQRILAEVVVEDSGAELQGLQEQFKTAGISLPYDGPLSVNEALLFLMLLEKRDQKVAQFQKEVRCRCSAWARQMGDDPRICLKDRPESFPRLRALLVSQTFQSDRRAFLRFRNALYCFKDKERWPFRPDSPSSLVRTGATVDRMLKSVNDAFAADMNDLFLDPLLARIHAVGAGRGKDSGVSLVGRTRIVVTSGLEAELTPEMASFVESGRPKPFGTELLNLAFPASEAGATTKPDVLTGAGKILAGLPDAQALLLAAALSAETEPAFTKVAPGIAINVRPTVLPDGGAARLTIDARFGVASTPQDTARTDIWREAPPAGISSHHLRTDASVSAFDLFDISSFSVTASHPRTPFYIPILGRLPILGPAFQIPRHNKEVLFESLVLVNTVILPRSIELHRFYGREITPRKAPGIDCREEEEAPTAEMEELSRDIRR